MYVEPVGRLLDTVVAVEWSVAAAWPFQNPLSFRKSRETPTQKAMRLLPVDEIVEYQNIAISSPSLQVGRVMIDGLLVGSHG